MKKGNFNKTAWRLRGALANIINNLQCWWIRRQIVPRSGTRRCRLEEEAITNYYKSLTKRSGVSEWSPDYQWRVRRDALESYCRTHAARLKGLNADEKDLYHAVYKLSKLEPHMPVTSEHLAALNSIISYYNLDIVPPERFSSWFPDLGLIIREGEKLSVEECIWFQHALLTAKYHWHSLVFG